MGETQIPLPGNALTDPYEALPSSVEIEINGLKYQLCGQIPEIPDKFELFIELPDDVWQKIRPKVESELKTNSWFAQQYQRTQQALRLGDGKIGSVWLSPGNSPEGVQTLHIDRIQTELGYLPEDSEYHKARGVGSAILDNLCALADNKGWILTLKPVERDGRLVGTDLQDWYKRRGFQFAPEIEGQQEVTKYPPDYMLRLPGKPDYSQPIIQLFNNA